MVPQIDHHTSPAVSSTDGVSALETLRSDGNIRIPGQSGRCTRQPATESVGIVHSSFLPIPQLGAEPPNGLPSPLGMKAPAKACSRPVHPAQATILTDGARQLRRFADLGYQHEYFTQLGSDIPAHVKMPAVHMAASQLKRWIDGTLQQGISREQLAYYLDEFTFRFNRRTARSRGLLFYRLLQQCTNTDPAPLKNLVIHFPAQPIMPE